MNIKQIAVTALGGFLGYKAGEKFSSSEIAKWGGAAAGAYVGHVVGKKI